MVSVNKVILLGNLGADPVLRAFPDGGSVTNVTLATTEYRHEGNGNRTEYTAWHRLRLTGRQAEIMCEHCKKGALIYIEGSIHYAKWKDAAEVQRYTADIHVSEFKILENKGSKAGEDDGKKPAAPKSLASKQKDTK